MWPGTEFDKNGRPGYMVSSVEADVHLTENRERKGPWGQVTFWILGTALFYICFEGTCVTSQRTWTDEPRISGRRCQLDDEGQWSIGIYGGPSPFELKPIEELEKTSNDSDALQNVANPVYTCAKVEDVESSFVADPFLWSTDGEIYMFFETKSLHNMQGDIGAAVSKDGGLTFEHIGVVLDEPWHLSYPFVFSHEGQVYMMPEGSKSGSLRLYRATDFPRAWVLDSVLIDQPLIDASLVLPRPDAAPGDGKWYLLASNRNQKSSKNCRELEVWFADNLRGPWKPHPLNPVREWQQGSRMAGRPFFYNGSLYRYGQDCSFTYGHKLRMFRIDVLKETEFHEEEVSTGLQPLEGLRGESDWNGVRQHHLDVQQLLDGTWIAAMDGDRFVSDYLTFRWLRRLALLLPLSAVTTALLLSILHSEGLGEAWGRQMEQLARALSGGGGGGSGGGCSAILRFIAWLLLPGTLSWGFSRRQREGSQGSSARSMGLCAPSLSSSLASPEDSDDVEEGAHKKPPHAKHGYLLAAVGHGGRRCFESQLEHKPCKTKAWPRGRFLSRWIWGALLALGLLLGFALVMFYYFRLQTLSVLTWYVETYGGNPLPVPVDDHFSKFSLLVMSYDAREPVLQSFLRHYSQCTSVGEIVVVWNKGAPPDPYQDLSTPLPIRVRVEQRNSMNNRFRPDPELRHRGVLMLDDDVLLSCSDIERGFARWRAHPERITGYYARLLEGDVPAYRCKHCEDRTYQQGRFNVILAGASFVDSHLVFEAYTATENAAGRAYVDRVFNCDDLLLNYVMAAKLNGTQYVDWVRPNKRIDVGRLTAARLSTGNFGPVRHQCTRDFAEMFGNPLRGKTYELDWLGLRKPVCLGHAGCMYI